MAVVIPYQFVPALNYMVKHTGIDFNVLACQANLESGFNTGAVSPAGAEGWLQFLPSTFYAYGSGSPFNMWDAAYAYVNFMNTLLRWAGGSVDKALAAYNAGQGNWQAGLGYASEILSCAGVIAPIVLPPGPGTAPAPAPGRGDDWSPGVGATAGWFHGSAGVIANYARAVRRI